jgi:ubiquinone/menaquinone biosynthesis C-methylase UbiE
MAEVSQFTQPDSSPAYFIDFLDFLDNRKEIQNLRRDIEQRLSLSAGQKVIDVGCGIGGATFPIADLVGPTGQVVGVDISAALIEVATRRASNKAGIEFRLGDVCALPFPDDFFDVARSERVFLYLPDRLAAIHEIRRVVKPGGRVVLVDTDFDSCAIYSATPDLTRKYTSIVASSMPNPNSARELPALARQAGLKAVTVETFAVTTPHEFLARIYGGALSSAVERGVVTQTEIVEWLTEQASLQASGNFFHAWLFVVVSGTA